MIDKVSCAFNYFYSFVQHPDKEALSQKFIRKLFIYKMVEQFGERAILYTGHKRFDTILKYYLDRRNIDKLAQSTIKIGLSLPPQVLKTADYQHGKVAEWPNAHAGKYQRFDPTEYLYKPLMTGLLSF